MKTASIHDLYATLAAMRHEFGAPYEIEQGGCGVTWKLTINPLGHDILRAANKAQLLRDMQTYRDGLRDGRRMGGAA